MRWSHQIGLCTVWSLIRYALGGLSSAWSFFRLISDQVVSQGGLLSGCLFFMVSDQVVTQGGFSSGWPLIRRPFFGIVCHQNGL